MQLLTRQAIGSVVMRRPRTILDLPWSALSSAGWGSFSAKTWGWDTSREPIVRQASLARAEQPVSSRQQMEAELVGRRPSA